LSTEEEQEEVQVIDQKSLESLFGQDWVASARDKAMSETN
jgi:hypothetical protein